MASSENACCEGMGSLLESFMNATNIDHQSSAFKKLRPFVTSNSRLNASSNLSQGIDGATMSTFLKALIAFGQRRKVFADQVDEVIKCLDKSGGESWQMRIAELQSKGSSLSSTSLSNSAQATSTSPSLDPLPEDLKEDHSVESVGKSCPAGSDSMRPLLQSFMDAKTSDDHRTAFQKLRCFVKDACRSKGCSHLSEDIAHTTMSTFLKALIAFGQRRKVFADQVDEVIKCLDKSGGESWQMRIAELQSKGSSLSSTSLSNSAQATSTSPSLDPLPEDLKEDHSVESVGKSCPAGSDSMRPLLQSFMDAKTSDDHRTAFQKLRCFVKDACRSKGCSHLSEDVTHTTMSTFLEALNAFGSSEHVCSNQIVEVIQILDNYGGKHWQEHIADLQTKHGNLSSASSSNSVSTTSTSASSDPLPPSALSLPEDLQEEGQIGKLVERENAISELKMLDGTTCKVPETDLRRIDTDSSVLGALHFRPDQAADSVHKLHAALSELLSLLSDTETNDRRKAILKQIGSGYRKEWTRILEDKDLHYVIAGLVSSGKTTLTNGLLAHSMPGQWTGKMLQSAALENTAAVTMFAYNAERAKKDGKIHARIEAVRMTRSHDGEAPRYQSHDDESSSTVNCMKELKDEMPLLSDKLAGTHDGFKRLIVEIPSPLSVIPGMTPTAPNMLSSEVLVDTPGLDSFGLKEHLVSILAQKCFLYCFVVDVQSPSPFGNHGFEVLQHLAKNVEMMFPPVIIFTKLKLLEEESSLRTWKKANPGGLRQRLKDLVNRTLDKLEEAGVRHCPFFADVDALWASMDCKDCPEDKEQIQAAQEGLSEFFQDLVCLGRNIAVPLHQCRMLQLQNMTTQQIINEIHKEDGQRLLEGEHLNDLRELGEKLKKDFSANVDRYFNVKWTDGGIASYEPQPPFDRDTCAISRIPEEFKKIFAGYKKRKPEVGDKCEAVTEVVEETSESVVRMISSDLSKYEKDALGRFKDSLWKKVGEKDLELVEKHLSFTLWQYLVGGGLGGGSVLAGVAAGETVLFFAGVASVTVLASVAVGVTVCALGIVGCVAWMKKDKIGGWSWEEAENASWKAVLEFCDKNSLRISKHVKSGFNQKVDDILKKIEDHRISECSISECKASKIQSAGRKGYKDVAEQLGTILGDKKERWLGKKPSALEQICHEVLEERQ